MRGPSRFRRKGVGPLVFLALGLFAVTSLGSGCAAMQRLWDRLFQRPTISFESVEVREISLSGLTMDLSWRVENPNNVGMRLDRLTYAFDVEGSTLASGTQEQGLDLAAGGHSIITLPFELRFADFGRSIVSVLTQDSFNWTARGTMGFDTPAGTLSAPFERKGITSLPDLPSINLDGVRVTRISMSGATLSLDLRLENSNSFPVPLEKLAYAVNIAGSDVATGVTSPPVLEAGRQRTLSIPVNVSFAGAGQAVAGALRSGEAEVAFTGRLTSGTVDLPVDLSRRIDSR